MPVDGECRVPEDFSLNRSHHREPEINVT